MHKEQREQWQVYEGIKCTIIDGWNITNNSLVKLIVGESAGSIGPDEAHHGAIKTKLVIFRLSI